jgi:hypothetical protein
MKIKSIIALFLVALSGIGSFLSLGGCNNAQGTNGKHQTLVFGEKQSVMLDEDGVWYSFSLNEETIVYNYIATYWAPCEFYAESDETTPILGGSLFLAPAGKYSLYVWNKSGKSRQDILLYALPVKNIPVCTLDTAVENLQYEWQKPCIYRLTVAQDVRISIEVYDTEGELTPITPGICYFKTDGTISHDGIVWEENNRALQAGNYYVTVSHVGSMEMSDPFSGSFIIRTI